MCNRIGSSIPENQVTEAKAIIKLSGLNPSKQSIKLAYCIARGELTTEEAIKQIIGRLSSQGAGTDC